MLLPLFMTRVVHQAATAALIVPALVAVRLLELDSPLGERNLQVLLVFAVGGALGAAAVGGISALLFRRLSVVARLGLTAFLVVPAIMLFSAGAFSIIVRDLAPSLGTMDLES